MNAGDDDRNLRRFQASVSVEAQALAWANKEAAPHGAAVTAGYEVAPRGRIGHIFWAPPEWTLACAVVVRPSLAADQGDAVWLAGGVAAARAAESVSGRQLQTWWPDLVVDAETGNEVVSVKATVQLGPGQVRSAVVTVRFDLDGLGLGMDRREDLLRATVASVDAAGGQLSHAGAVEVAAAYSERCPLLGRRVRLTLLPKGETRGIAREVDLAGRLVLASPTGMIERVAVDQLHELTVVERP